MLKGGQDLGQGDGTFGREGQVRLRVERHGHGSRFTWGEGDREGRCPAGEKPVAAARAGLGPDRQASFLQGEDVALDGPLGHFERLGERCSRRAGLADHLELFHQGIQPTRAVHGAILPSNRDRLMSRIAPYALAR